MKDPNIDFRTLKSEEILILYKEMDKQIKNDLLEGATWETLKNKIFTLLIYLRNWRREIYQLNR